MKEVVINGKTYQMMPEINPSVSACYGCVFRPHNACHGVIGLLEEQDRCGRNAAIYVAAGEEGQAQYLAAKVTARLEAP